MKRKEKHNQRSQPIRLLAWWIYANVGMSLVFAALAIQIPRLTAAFVISDASLGNIRIASFTGPGFAVLIAFGAFFTFSTWETINASRAISASSRLYKGRHILLVFTIFQVATEPLVIWPTIVSNVTGESLVEVLTDTSLGDMGMVLLWSLLVAAIPTIVLAGVSVAHAMRTSVKALEASKSGRKSVASGASDYARKCAVCGSLFTSAAAYSGHWKEANHQAVKAKMDAGELIEEANGELRYPDGTPFRTGSNNHHPERMPINKQ